MSTPFHRTPSGLSNLAVFLGVDVVVYLEGGEKQYTLTDLENETSASENYDTMFWQAVFRVFRPRLKAHFKSIGSKTTVLSVSRLVAAGSVRNVVTALDRDLDHVRRAKLRHPNILYTYGYSWENDVFTKVNLKTLTGRMCMNHARCKDLEQKIDGAYARLARAFRILVDWEYSLARFGAAACDRSALTSTIELRPPNAPNISRTKIAKILRGSCLSNRNLKLCKRRATNVYREIHGHTLERLCLGLLQHLFASTLSLRLTNDACTRLLVGLFERSLRGRSPASQHYRKAAASLMI
jgi:hypothetical protein